MNKICKLRQIETSRLLIRPVQLSDENLLNKIQWSNKSKSTTIRDFVQRSVFGWDSGCARKYSMIVLNKEHDRAIAVSRYTNYSDGLKQTYAIEYSSIDDCQNQSLMTECFNALIRYAFDVLDAEQVVLAIPSNNNNSIDTAKSLNIKNHSISDLTLSGCPLDATETNHVIEIDSQKHLPPLNYAWNDISDEHLVHNIIAWAKNTLNINDEKVFADSKTIVKNEWSKVFEIHSHESTFYLKQTPKDFYLEAETIKFLRSKNINNIPELVAENSDNSCFLMKKCGDMSLRDYLNGKLQLDLVKQAITGYKKIQHHTTTFMDELIAIGVPDWRLDNLPGLYIELISNTEFLSDNKITKEQQYQLHQFKDKVKILCNEISSLGVHETLNHADFHDNNILYDITNQQTAIIDFAETAITHPFFSLLAFLKDLKTRYSLADDSADYLSLMHHAFDDCLGDTQSCKKAINMTNLLLPLYLILAQKRFLTATKMILDKNNPVSVKQHEKIHKGFVQFIKNMETIESK